MIIIMRHFVLSPVGRYRKEGGGVRRGRKEGTEGEGFFLPRRDQGQTKDSIDGLE
jgi:hypothetical protein